MIKKLSIIALFGLVVVPGCIQAGWSVFGYGFSDLTGAVSSAVGSVRDVVASGRATVKSARADLAQIKSGNGYRFKKLPRSVPAIASSDKKRDESLKAPIARVTRRRAPAKKVVGLGELSAYRNEVLAVRENDAAATIKALAHPVEPEDEIKELDLEELVRGLPRDDHYEVLSPEGKTRWLEVSEKIDALIEKLVSHRGSESEKTDLKIDLCALKMERYRLVVKQVGWSKSLSKQVAACETEYRELLRKKEVADA